MFKGLTLWFSSLIFRVYCLRDKVKVFTSDFLNLKRRFIISGLRLRF
jgi:hypothetical protein